MACYMAQLPPVARILCCGRSHRHGAGGYSVVAVSIAGFQVLRVVGVVVATLALVVVFVPDVERSKDTASHQHEKTHAQHHAQRDHPWTHDAAPDHMSFLMRASIATMPFI